MMHGKVPFSFPRERGGPEPQATSPAALDPRFRGGTRQCLREDAIVAAARACLGARFRLHGRRIASGLDCLGVVAVAYGLDDLPAGYAMRGGRLADLIAGIETRGFIADTPAPARLLLLDAGPFQHHLAVVTDRGFIHADAGLRRVVETPGRPRWPLSGCWRAPAERN